MDEKRCNKYFELNKKEESMRFTRWMFQQGAPDIRRRDEGAAKRKFQDLNNEGAGNAKRQLH